MSDLRPKRSSAFSSFYIDEDDFENDSMSVGKSKKILKEEVFVIPDKYDYDSESKSIAHGSSSSDSEELESKPCAKITAKQAKNQQNITKKTTTKTPTTKSKTFNPKAASKIQSKAKSFDDDFELVVDKEHSSESDQEYQGNNGKLNEADENFDEQSTKAFTGRGSVAAKKMKPTQQIKKNQIATIAQRPSIASNRPRFPTSMEKVKIPGQMSGPRRVGLSRSAPIRPLSPVKLKKFDL